MVGHAGNNLCCSSCAFRFQNCFSQLNSPSDKCGEASHQTSVFPIKLPAVAMSNGPKRT